MARKKAEALLPGMRQKTAETIEYRFTYKGKQYSVSGKTPTECVLKKDAKQKDIDSKAYKKAEKLTVGEYFDRWIDNRRAESKETTIRTNTILLNRMRETVIDGNGTRFGDLMLKEVETQNVRDLRKGLQKELKTKDKNDRDVTRPGMTTRSTNDSIYLLRQVYKTAIQEKATTWNPAEGIKPLKRVEPSAGKTIHRAITKAETVKFLEAARESHYFNLYQFLINTGLRLGETGALKIGDVTGNSVRVCRTITRTEVGGYVIGDDAKTEAGVRTVPLNASALEAWNRQLEENEILEGVTRIGVPVFRALRGGLLKSANVNADIAKICDKAGIERIAAHAFRDLFATRCAEAKMPPETLKEIMGHTDIKMTYKYYIHVMDEQKQEQLKAVNFM